MIDWDTIVLGPVMGVFGEDPAQLPTYRPAGGPAAFELADAVFDDGALLVDLLDGRAPASTTNPVLGVRLANFPAGVTPQQNDRVDIPRAGWRYVVNNVQPDSHGHVLLQLTQVVRL